METGGTVNTFIQAIINTRLTSAEMNIRFRAILTGLFVAACIAAAGHFYALHHQPSRRDIPMAYLLGLLSGFLLYSTIMSKYLPLGNGKYIKAATLLPEGDDENNTVYQEPAFYEHEFFFNWWIKLLNLSLFSLLLVIAVFYAIKGRYIPAGLLLCVFGFVIGSALKEFLDRKPQIRIAKAGIWLKGYGYYPWAAIKKVATGKNKTEKNSYVKLKVFLNKTKENDEEDEDYEDEYMFPIEIRLDEIKGWKEISSVLQNLSKAPFENNSK